MATMVDREGLDLPEGADWVIFRLSGSGSAARRVRPAVRTI